VQRLPQPVLSARRLCDVESGPRLGPCFAVALGVELIFGPPKHVLGDDDGVCSGFEAPDVDAARFVVAHGNFSEERSGNANNCLNRAASHSR
jgi:hypothetical protein